MYYNLYNVNMSCANNHCCCSFNQIKIYTYPTLKHRLVSTNFSDGE